MIDLSTRYLGLELANPIVASASPLTGHVETLRRLEEAGVSAVVLPSLFEEQIEHEQMEAYALDNLGSEAFAEAMSGYFPELPATVSRSEKQLQLITDAKRALSVPVIASLNGTTTGGWLAYAKLMEDAGADAIELNVYFVPADPTETSAHVEARYVHLVETLASKISIPLTVKMSPFFSAPANMAMRLVEAGAHGIVMFNRFMQPDIDLETLTVTPHVQLSTPAEVRLPLRWIAILRHHVQASIAATTGAHTSEDVLKLLLAGADAVCLASALLRNGPGHAERLLSGVRAWMEEREYASVEQLKGSVAQRSIQDPNAYERANYMSALTSYTPTVT
ncbi:MAG: dihydroorotate dehydrogenase-like protein [Deltaproteobacteria bacterium]|jgi:dihydroorotate dehydrogenase (fumarate)